MERRHTQGVLTEWNQNKTAVSKIPAPGRQSLAPRLSISNRQSLKGIQSLSNEMQGMTLNDRRASTRPDMRQSMSRRSSVKHGHGMLKDPRNIRDKTFQNICIKNLLQFLVNENFEQNVSQKLLYSPSSKDFQNIFTFLHNQFDPSFRFTKKIDEDVIPIIKNLKYPFANDIAKSHLLSVGSPHSWPTILAMLSWMVELVMATKEIRVDRLDLHPDTQPEQYFYDFLSRAYVPYIRHQKSMEQTEADLKATFDARNASILESIKFLESEAARLQSEYDELVSVPDPLIRLEHQKAEMLADVEKYKKFIKHLTGKIEKLEQTNEEFKNDNAQIDAEISSLNQQKEDLQIQIEAQPISSDDIDRMNNEKESLLKTLDNLALQKEELTNTSWTREVALQKKIDAVEKLAQSFNFVAETLLMIPKEAANSGNVDYEIMINLHGVQIEEIHPKNGKLKGFLLKVREKYAELVHKTEDKNTSMQEQLSRLYEAASDFKLELDSAESRAVRINEEYVEERQMMNEDFAKTSKEIEEIESKIRKMKMDKTSTLSNAQQALQRAKIE